MPGLLSGSTLRRGGSGQFIDLKGAQPQLPPSPSTSTGFTIVTSDKLVTTYSSSLGNLEFNTSTVWSNQNKNIVLIATGTNTSIVVQGSVATTSTNTGALVVEGGVGISGNLFVGGDFITNIFTATTATVYNLKITSTEVSLNTATGALVVAGGVGIGKNLNIGSTLFVGSTSTFNSAIFAQSDVLIKGELTVDGSGEVVLSPQAANVDIRPTAGGTIIIQPSLTGSIDDMVIGGNVRRDSYFLNSYANNFIGLATTATNIEKGKLGSIPYQTSANQTAFIDIGNTNTVLVSNGSTATWANFADVAVTTSTYSSKVFVSSATNANHYIILSTSTNSYSDLVEDSDFYYSSNYKELFVQTITASQSIYSREGIAEESNLLYTPRSTLQIGTPPVSPRLGDFWIDPSQGATFQYILDGTNKVWVQFTGL
jgi:hypothetical protein